MHKTPERTIHKTFHGMRRRLQDYAQAERLREEHSKNGGRSREWGEGITNQYLASDPSTQAKGHFRRLMACKRSEFRCGYHRAHACRSESHLRLPHLRTPESQQVPR